MKRKFTFLFYFCDGSVKKVTAETEGKAWTMMGLNMRHIPLLKFYHIAKEKRYVSMQQL